MKDREIQTGPDVEYNSDQNLKHSYVLACNLYVLKVCLTTTSEQAFLSHVQYMCLTASWGAIHQFKANFHLALTSAGCSHIILMCDILRACDLIPKTHSCFFQIAQI